MKKCLLFVLSSLFIINTFCQSVTIGDSTGGLISNSPYVATNDYSYGQTIYLESEIQGSGTITRLTYYYGGPSLNKSDSLLIFIGNTKHQYLDDTLLLIRTDSMKKVFQGNVSYSNLPGPVTIILDSPFYYSGAGNLVIAVNEKRPGNQYAPNTTPVFKGFDKYIRNHPRSSFYVDLNQMDPYVVENKPPFFYQGASGGIATVTLHGLNLFPCQSPKRVHFTNVNHDNAKVLWSPPANADTSVRYEIYYSTDQTDPTAASILQHVGIKDTVQTLTGLQPSTTYMVWVRTRCSTTSTSVWTLVDSFKTICAPTSIPTATEQFSTFLPGCWIMATGNLTANTQLTYDNTNPLSPNHPWSGKAWRNVSASNDSAASVLFGSNTSNWLISPPYTLGAGGSIFEFDIALTKLGYSTQGTFDADDTVAVVISSDNGTTWSRANILKVWHSSQPISGAGQHVLISLGAYTGPVRLGFYASSVTFGSTTNRKEVFIDNVKLSAVMPVTLMEFAGNKQDNTNLLNWRTATEQNNKGYELQRSINGVEFSTISFIPSLAKSGNSTAILGYEYIDKQPLAGNNYYRLKQVDFDGHFTYSNVVLLKQDKSKELQVTRVYPNPAKDKVNVLLFAPLNEQVRVIVTDMTGRVVKEQPLYINEGDTNIALDVANLQHGTYMIKAVCANGCTTSVSKFVKE